MKIVYSIVLACFSAAAWATTTNSLGQIVNPKLSKAEMREIFRKYEGGKIVKPGTMTGKLVVVNCQSNATDEVIKESLVEFNNLFRGKMVFAIALTKGEFKLTQPKVLGNATLFIVDDQSLPTILSAPEDRWTMVNVSKLSSGDGAKPAFFTARVKKEMMRGLCILSGAQNSNYPMSLLGCKTKPEDLDSHADTKIAVDIVRRLPPYLEGYGIRPGVIFTYRKACQEGWAPSPTNDLQKAVWDEIHSVPTKPIEIKP